MTGLSDSVSIDRSRREFLTRFIKPVTQAKTTSPAFPDGVNILLLKDQCIAWGRGICDRCNHVCQPHALLFVGLMNPRVMQSRCTYCNLCVEACPVDAIVLRPGIIQESEDQPT